MQAEGWERNVRELHIKIVWRLRITPRAGWRGVYDKQEHAVCEHSMKVEIKKEMEDRQSLLYSFIQYE